LAACCFCGALFISLRFFHFSPPFSLFHQRMWWWWLVDWWMMIEWLSITGSRAHRFGFWNSELLMADPKKWEITAVSYIFLKPRWRCIYQYVRHVYMLL
jgi:hypothetical protein